MIPHCVDLDKPSDPGKSQRYGHRYQEGATDQLARPRRGIGAGSSAYSSICVGRRIMQRQIGSGARHLGLGLAWSARAFA
jgi:hypothetical protein